MAVQRANRSERLYESVWLRCGGDPLERILRRVDSWGGSAICPFRLPGRTSGGAEVAFELMLLPTLAKRERSIAFLLQLLRSLFKGARSRLQRAS